jgi:hypothetical protein
VGKRYISHPCWESNLGLQACCPHTECFRLITSQYQKHIKHATLATTWDIFTCGARLSEAQEEASVIVSTTTWTAILSGPEIMCNLSPVFNKWSELISSPWPNSSSLSCRHSLHFLSELPYSLLYTTLLTVWKMMYMVFYVYITLKSSEINMPRLS